MEKTDPKDKLTFLRADFPANQISRLPKGTKEQNSCPPAQKKRCAECGGWHHPHVVHLDYVGHAAVTDRLLDADLAWYWEPLALTPEGLPRFDNSGGLWIKLTVLGVSRLGYGHAAPKDYADPGAREKEVIGDAIRNAAMRFGVALPLWHKGELHKTATEEDGPSASGFEALANELLKRMENARSKEELASIETEARSNFRGKLETVYGFGEAFAALRNNALSRLSND